MPWLVPVALTAYSAISANQQNKKAQGAAAEAARTSQVDIEALDAKTREIAKQNALQSAALEQQLTPEVPALRSAANQGVLGGLGATASEQASQSALMGGLGQDVGSKLQTPLLRAAIAKAKADLELGGQLPQDVKNLVTRRALANAGAVGGGGLGLARDISARDLGLTSLDLENRRLQNAAAIGSQEAGIEQFDVGTQFNNASHQLNIMQLLQALGNNQFGRNLSAAQYGESIARPVVGLDPGSVADVTIGNTNNRTAALSNQANIAGQQSNNYMNLAGQGLGYSLLQYNAGNKPVNPYQTTNQQMLNAGAPSAVATRYGL